MKKWLVRIGIGFAVLVAVSFAVEVGEMTLDPQGWAQRRKEREERAEADAHSRIQEHGFAVGMTLAKSGMKKPSSDEADSMARKAALELGEDADLGFKAAWKRMFWLGWSKGGG